MLTDFVSLMLSREELKEVWEALLMRATMEDDVRQAEGLEPVDYRPLFERVHRLLGATDEQADELEDELDQEIWHHAWHAYTDEWAWFRARQETLRELGGASLREPALDDLIHRRYHEKYDDYVREIDMLPEEGQKETKQGKTK